MTKDESQGIGFVGLVVLVLDIIHIMIIKYKNPVIVPMFSYVVVWVAIAFALCPVLFGHTFQLRKYLHDRSREIGTVLCILSTISCLIGLGMCRGDSLQVFIPTYIGFMAGLKLVWEGLKNHHYKPCQP